MRISDWSSDVCSSDLLEALTETMRTGQGLMLRLAENQMELKPILARLAESKGGSEALVPQLRNIETYQIGRESCRERVCQYVEHSVVAVYLKQQISSSVTRYMQIFCMKKRQQL